MFKWLREWYELKDEYKQEKMCESCETLRMQLAIANDEKRDLLNRLLNPIVKEEVPMDTSDLKPIMPRRHLSWAARKQLLEAEDRDSARKLKEVKLTTEELEKELDIPKESTNGKI